MFSSGNNNMFGGGLTSLDDQLRQAEYYRKIQEAQRMQGAQETNILDKIKQELMGLSHDEVQQISDISEFKNTKAIYDAGFLDFLGSKFANEYISTPIGKQAAENLYECTVSVTKKMRESNKNEINKLKAVAQLIESDPDMLKKLEELSKKQSTNS